MSANKKIELLAPARDLQTAIAAIDCGADAVYMGGPGFGARKAAGNTVGDIARAVEYARTFGVRVYATLNTLVFDDELPAAETAARELVSAGVSALIVQDMAYMEMGIPGVELHASTQTCNIDPQGVRFLYESGFSRVILERSLSLKQIKEIAAASDAELEAFIHGALCVCRSGRCYMSRTMGPRSGNRGDCSQPCRLSYDLVDSSGKEIIHGKHLLSLRDFDLSERVGDLLDAGISSFKIEGRLKDSSYVKNTVAYYRRVLDAEIARRPGMERASQGASMVDFTPDLSKTFSRTGSLFYIDGLRAGVASLDTPKAKGEFLGRVSASGQGWFELDTKTAVGAGDGICYMDGSELTGMNINKAEGRRVFTGRNAALKPGTEIFRNYDRAFDRMLSRSRTRRVIDASAQVSYRDGKLTVAFSDGANSVSSEYADGWTAAENPARMEEVFRAQLSKSGDSPFRITEVSVHYDDALPFIPAGQLNAMRRDGLAALLAARQSQAPELNIKTPDASFPSSHKSIGPDTNVTNRLSERFYRSHGVENIARGLDLRETLHGECVMTTPYCIRRETGLCLREKPTVKGDLFLRRGTYTYRLDFDCAECVMKVIFVDRSDRQI